MKIRKALSYLGVYSLTAASVIPSPITSYAFNLLAFGAVVLLIIALFMAMGSKGIVEAAVTGAKSKGRGPLEEEKFSKGRRGLLITYIPAAVVMVVFGHWFVGGCLLITYGIMLELFNKVAKELREDEKE